MRLCESLQFWQVYLIVVIALCFASLANGQSLQPSDVEQDIPESKQIAIELVDGRYDANLLRQQLAMVSNDQPDWVPFQPADALALAALEITGRIKFEQTPQSLQISLPPDAFSEIAYQLAPCRLTLPKDIADDARVFVFVHGLEGGQATFAAARQRCKAHGVVAASFDYPNDGPAEISGDRFCAQLNVIAREHPTLRLTIVAHSLGGLVATWAVTSPNLPENLVTDVFTLGTPFKGSAIAEFQEESELLYVGLSVLGRDFSRLDTLTDGKGEAAIDLLPGSEFLQRLHQRKVPASIRFHLAAGKKSFLDDEVRAALSREVPLALKRKGVSEEYIAKLTRLVDANESVNGKADGAVTINSAFGLSQPKHCQRVFEKTHLELLGDAVTEQHDEVFQWLLDEMGW